VRVDGKDSVAAVVQAARAGVAADVPMESDNEGHPSDDVPPAAVELQPEVAVLYIQQLLGRGCVTMGLPDAAAPGEAACTFHGDTLQVSLESFLALETELANTAPTGGFTPPPSLGSPGLFLFAYG
jgi:hypothetical protein